jgi:hypothetical protein
VEKFQVQAVEIFIGARLFLRGCEQFTPPPHLNLRRDAEMAKDNSLRVWRHNCTTLPALTNLDFYIGISV